MRAPRRRSSAAALLTVLFLAITACGSGTPTTTGGSTTSESQSANASPDQGYPLEIPNAFGSTVIPAKPERVVVAGFTEIDTAVALGVQPVAVQRFVAAFTDGFGPWTAERITGDKPVVFEVNELNFEQIASLQPDLILAVNRTMTDVDYERLTAIAPTVARPAEYGDYGVPPDVSAKLVGRALGQEPEITAMLDSVAQQVTAARTANPGLAGKTFSVVWPRGADGWYVWTSIDNRTRLLTDLGMTLSPEVLALDQEKFYVEVSAEQTPVIDADVVLILDVQNQKAVVEADPVFRSLPAVQAGNAVWITDINVIGAFSYSSVLSLPYALEQIVPPLAAAAG